MLAWIVLISTFLQPARNAPVDAASSLAQAREHFERQQWEECQKAAVKALEINPRLGDAEVLLGLVATAQSQFEEAGKHFRKAVSLQPRNPRVHAYLGSTYLQQKRFAEAVRAFRKVLELDPKSSTANYNLGLINLLQGNPAAALGHFEVVHQADPLDAAALTGILESELLLKRARRVGPSLRKLEALLEPRDPRLFQVAAMLAHHGRYASAIRILERVREVSLDSYDVNYNLALAYYRSGEHDKAAEKLQAVLNRSQAPEAYDLLGSIEEGRDRPLQAIKAFQKAVQFEPTNEDYRFDYASAVLRHHGPAEATTLFASAAHDLPHSWRIFVGLGVAHYLAGRFEEAAQALLEAVKINPQLKLAYYLLGQAYESTASLQSAITDAFRAYLDRKPDDPWAYYHYATIVYQNAQRQGEHDFKQAHSNLQKALDLDPAFAHAYLQLGIIAQSEQRFQESFRWLKRAIALDPKLSAAHYRLGIAYQRLGEAEKARIELELFQKLKSDSEAAEREIVVRSLSENRR